MELNKMTTDELYFYWWLEEAEKYHLITDIEYQPPSYPLLDKKYKKVTKHLKTKIVFEDKMIFDKWSYTADFRFKVPSFTTLTTKKLFNDIDHLERPLPVFITSRNACVVEIKPMGRSPFRTKSDDLFPINQKMAYHLYQDYVNKIICFKLFEKTWTPAKVIADPNLIYKVNTKFGKVGQSKLKYKVRSYYEYVNV